MSTAAGLYRPGSSPLHRAPAGPKLAALALLVVTLLVVRSPAALLAGSILVAGSYALAGIPARVAVAQVRPLLPFLSVLALFQTVVAGWGTAVVVCGQLAVAVAAAGVVTLTTRVSAMLDTAERVLRPLRPFGVDPARAGLVLALAVRALPLVAAAYGQVREAQRARGLERSLRALAVPLVVRVLRQADLLGEALVARGVDD